LSDFASTADAASAPSWRAVCVARLSSFQRTDAVRQWRPTDLAGLAPVPPFRSDAGKACRMPNAARLGEPSEVTGTTWPCQP